MTRAEEVRRWRRIGRAFETLATTGTANELAVAGLCRAALYVGLPAYGDPGSRVASSDDHGLKEFQVNFWRVGGNLRHTAAHRALTAYLLAEMVADGCAPGDPPRRQASA